MQPQPQNRPLPFAAIALLGFLFMLWAGLLRPRWSPPGLSGLGQVSGSPGFPGFPGALIVLARAVANLLFLGVTFSSLLKVRE
jgi:hypothetical protein